MVEVLHLTALLPATVGLCCAAGDRRGRTRAVVPAAVMMLAMFAMAAGWPLLPPLVWAGVLLLVAIGGAAARRFVAASRSPRAAHTRHMELHRALGLVLGAALLVASGAHEGTAVAGHVAHSAGGSPFVMTMAGSAGYLAFTVWLVAREARQRRPLVGIVEATAMGLMTATMSIAPFVA